MINIIIVDDHPLVRLGIKSALKGEYSDICIVGEAGDGKSLFQLLETMQADIVMLDIVLPGMSGVEISRRLRNEYPRIKILIISVENTLSVVEELLDIGIDGFISKQKTCSKELPQAIYSIMEGTKYFGRDIASLLYDIYLSKKEILTTKLEFSNRELEIITLCRDGLQTKEIAKRLNINTRTVDTHKYNIFKKLGINSTMELVLYAVKSGIITD